LNKRWGGSQAENTRKKCNGRYEKKAEEDNARQRRNRDPGRRLALPLAPAALGAGVGEVVDVEVDVEVEEGIVAVDSLELSETADGVAVVVGAGKELGRGRETDVDSVPTVTVCVSDEVDEFEDEVGMGIDEVAAASGESNDPDIPVRLKNGENPMTGILSFPTNWVEVKAI